MAIDIVPGSNALEYTHFTSGNNQPLCDSITGTNGPVTIFARVKLHGTPGSLGAAIVKFDLIPPGLGGSFFYMMLGVGPTRFAFVTTSSFSSTGAPSLSLTPLEIGTWYNVCGVWRNNVFRQVWLDGVPGLSNTLAKGHGNYEGILIGASHTSSSAFNRPLRACVEDVTIWRRELTEAEIIGLNTAPDVTSLHKTDIPFHCPFADAATATVAWDYRSGSPVAVPFFQDGTSGSVADCNEPPPEETGEVPIECEGEDEADATSACDVDWPTCDLVPTRISVDVVAPSVSPGRSFSGFEQLIQPDAGHFRIVYSGIPIRTRAHALQWRKIESTLSGRNGTVCVPVYEGVLSSTPIVATAVDAQPIGVTRLDIEQTAGADIRAGMHFSAGDRLYRITRITADEDDGVLSIAIWPPLRQAIAASDSLDFNTPSCRCRLERDDSMDANLELLRFGSPSVVFVEDV